MKQYFKDTKLTFHDSVNFFSGLGEYILSHLPSIGRRKRRASLGFIHAVQKLIRPTIARDKLPEYHLAMIKACTVCEMTFPLAWSTITMHSMMEVFEPERGRVALYGAPKFLNMAAIERFNMLLRALVKARKNLERTIANRYLLYVLVNVAWRAAKLGDFILSPEQSTAVSQAGGYARDIAKVPLYLLAEDGVSLSFMVGQRLTKDLSDRTKTQLKLFFALRPDKFDAEAIARKYFNYLTAQLN